ncbi:hypothetical protein [Paraburkholderia sp. RL17-373-BIF-A]|uniref:hypothetical protein n=1 Tax=Paraburkholderia sp. RL17-373-BIF-A TaxID=3031629 RepID=UPI0038B9DC30
MNDSESMLAQKSDGVRQVRRPTLALAVDRLFQRMLHICSFLRGVSRFSVLLLDLDTEERCRAHDKLTSQRSDTPYFLVNLFTHAERH